MFDAPLGDYWNRDRWVEVDIPQHWKKKFLTNINFKMKEREKEIDIANLQDILSRVKQVQGKKCMDEVRDIVSKYPDASGFIVTDIADGVHHSYAGTKVKEYRENDQEIFILILTSERFRGEGKKKEKVVYRKYLKFDKNEKTEENGEGSE